MAIIPASQLDVESYHRSARLSSSKLSDFARKGPRGFASLHVTRTSPPAPKTDALVFGQCFEDLVYGLPIHERYSVKPAGMSFAKVDGKAWKIAAEATGKPIITQDDYDAMVAMRDALLENETAMRMIAACQSQTTYTCEYDGTPGLQARPDWASHEGCIESGFDPFTLDLKSTIKLSQLANGRAVASYGYHSQAAVGRHCMRQNGIDRVRCFLLAVEKIGPYRSQVIEVTPDWTEIGWLWCDRQLSRLATHYRTNDWPRVESEMVALPPVPEWVANAAMGEEEEAA